MTVGLPGIGQLQVAHAANLVSQKLDLITGSGKKSAPSAAKAVPRAHAEPAHATTPKAQPHAALRAKRPSVRATDGGLREAAGASGVLSPGDEAKPVGSTRQETPAAAAPQPAAAPQRACRACTRRSRRSGLRRLPSCRG
jgi:hypothetical protein